MRCPHSASRSGWARVRASSSAVSSAWRPQPRSASTRASRTVRWASSNRLRSTRTNDASATSASAGPCHWDRASRSVPLAWRYSFRSISWRPCTISRSKRARSKVSSLARTRYPGDCVARASAPPTSCSPLRRRDTATRSECNPSLGGLSGQSSSTRRSDDTTRLTDNSRSARTARSRRPTSAKGRPSACTSTGPRIRNSTTTCSLRPGTHSVGRGPPSSESRRVCDFPMTWR